VYSLHITTVVSRQSEKITRLAQEVSILKQKIEESGEKTGNSGQ